MLKTTKKNEFNQSKNLKLHTFEEQKINYTNLKT
jgi:hypothetical protein